ncbi:MAG: hypothetical protein L3J18_15550 [Candidatus Brocadia sp.]|nr:MAG: hypothetical protein L3J18_15550 [Candidatus Brocadia sp.]
MTATMHFDGTLHVVIASEAVTIQRNIAPYRYELAKSGNLPRNTIRNA